MVCLGSVFCFFVFRFQPMVTVEAVVRHEEAADLMVAEGQRETKVPYPTLPFSKGLPQGPNCLCSS